MNDKISSYWRSRALYPRASAAYQSYTDPSFDELGLAALMAAKDDIGVVRETSSNWGPEIEQFLDHVDISFPAAWCAAAVHSWIDRASDKTGIKPPIEPTGGAQETMFRMEKIGRWIPKANIAYRDIKPGMILVWDRSDPEKGIPWWRGHIGIIEHIGDDGDTIHTIEGNMPDPKGKEPQGVYRIKRSLSAHRLLGFGVLSGPMPGETRAGTASYAMLIFGGAAGFLLSKEILKRAL